MFQGAGFGRLSLGSRVCGFLVPLSWSDKLAFRALGWRFVGTSEASVYTNPWCEFASACFFGTVADASMSLRRVTSC